MPISEKFLFQLLQNHTATNLDAKLQHNELISNIVDKVIVAGVIIRSSCSSLHKDSKVHHEENTKLNRSKKKKKNECK